MVKWKREVLLSLFLIAFSLVNFIYCGTMKTDIIKVISNYMEIDTDELDIQITQTQSEDNNGTVPVLYANIPIKSMRKMNHED